MPRVAGETPGTHHQRLVLGSADGSAHPEFARRNVVHQGFRPGGRLSIETMGIGNMSRCSTEWDQIAKRMAMAGSFLRAISER
jgi:hypothetical protein